MMSLLFMLMTMLTVPPAVPDESLSNEWIGKPAPALSAGEWINSKPLALGEQKGKVVLLEFWTFACSNCRNTVPYLNQWQKKFADQPFKIVGVHSPEFDREKALSNVQESVRKLGIEYAVVTDNDFNTWRTYKQQYWPCLYLIDKKGVIRYVHIGEGKYAETEKQIEALLAE